MRASSGLPCKAVCLLFGLQSSLAYCTLPEGHYGPHECRITIANPRSTYQIIWEME